MELEIIHRSADATLAKCGPLVIAVWHHETTVADVTEYAAILRQCLDSGETHLGLLTVGEV